MCLFLSGQMTDLLYTEKDLVTSLKDYIRAEESKLEQIKRWVCQLLGVICCWGHFSLLVVMSLLLLNYLYASATVNQAPQLLAKIERNKKDTEYRNIPTVSTTCLIISIRIPYKADICSFLFQLAWLQLCTGQLSHISQLKCIKRSALTWPSFTGWS